MVERRPPQQVMRLARLGSLHQCRLSFMRQLTRRMANENWTFKRTAFDIDTNGVGHAIYTATGPNRSYSLVAFAHDLPDEMRSDRVIAEAWDATFALFDGVPDANDIKRLSQNVPLQEAGRVSETELSLSRANRSARLWAYVIDCLASGQQPDAEKIAKVGYLMRTTAVYGSGKFGAADRAAIADRPELQSPFQAEMLSVYLTRWFVSDLVNFLAHDRGGDTAVALSDDIAKSIGIGNSTGLGMAPFIVNHPILFNNWIMAREEAIARVRSVEDVSKADVARYSDLFVRSEQLVETWRSEHPIQVEKLKTLNADLGKLAGWNEAHQQPAQLLWDQLIRWSDENLSFEGQELIASLVLELYPDLVDGLSSCMSDADTDAFHIDGDMSVGNMVALIQDTFGDLLDTDWENPHENARVWYVSEEKLEPRLGERYQEPIEPYEQPLAPARDACRALQALAAWPPDEPIAAFLAMHPEHRHTVRRMQMVTRAPYGEIRDNTISADLLPIDMLRAKLSFFGATHFDPRSDRWVRICMYSGAPYPPDLTVENADLWVYPEAVK